MLTEAELNELKDKHGTIVAVEAPTGTLVFRKPKRAEYDRWFDKSQADKAKASEHARELAQSCLVHPSRDGFLAALDDCPSLLCGEVLTAVTSLCGLQTNYEIKKL